MLPYRRTSYQEQKKRKMELFFQFFLLCIGLGLLWKGGELAVRYAVGLSEIFGIKLFTIGFFLFAISTGLPEISSAIVSSLKGIPELSAGDLMGSTFVNMSLILGVIALIGKSIEIDLSLRKELLWTIFLILAIFTGLVLPHNLKALTGILLILLYIFSAFLFQTRKQKAEAKRELKEIEEIVEKAEKKPLISPKIDILAKLLGSLVLLLVSSWVTVHAGAKLANMMEIGISIVGASFVAVGTSLPELALGIHAVRRKEFALILGDIFGASLLNVSFTLGMLILINQQVNLSIVKTIFPFLCAVIAWLLIRIFPKKPLTRLDGVILLSVFTLYLIGLGFWQKGLLAR